jgi:hypothetical protein
MAMSFISYEFQKEVDRVPKQNGCLIHVLPLSSRNFWENITSLLKNWMPRFYRVGIEEIRLVKYTISVIDGGFGCLVKRAG